MNSNKSPTGGMRSSESKTLDSESKVPENRTAAGPPNPSSESKALESEPKASENVTTAEPSKPSGKDDGSGERTREKGEDADDDEEEEEEEKCGICLFMKAGGCKESFVAWKNCITEGENKKENLPEKCFEVTAALLKCMEAHSDYYGADEPVKEVLDGAPSGGAASREKPE